MNDDGNAAWGRTGPCLDVDSEIDVRFAVLVARYGDMLRRFLQGLARRPEVAEDLSQQLWLKLLEAARDGRFLPEDDTALRSYLFAAARNLFIDECVRKHGSSRTTACDPAAIEALAGAGGDDGVDTAERSCDRDRNAAEIQRAIERLPDTQQSVIRLWMAGVSIERMVADTHACRDTVLSRKKYAFRRLKAELTGLRAG